MREMDYMDIIVFAIINILPVLVVADVSHYFMKQVYKKNSKYSSKLYFGVWGIFAIFYILIIQFQLGSNVMTIYGIVSLQIISFIYEKKKFKFLYTFLFYIYLVILDICSLPLVSMIFNVETYEVVSNPYIRIATPIISGIIMLGSVRLIVKCFVATDINRISKQISIIFSSVLICEGIMLLYGLLLSSKNEINNRYFLLSLFFFLAFDILGIYLYRLLNIESKLQKELSLSKQKDELEYKHFQSLQEEYDKSRKILHDIKNHIITLESLSASSNGEIPQKYIEDLVEKINESGYTFKSKSKIITVILSEKMALAKKEGITFSAKVQEVPFEIVSDLDWVTILGNILDNAIESCLRAPTNERRINFYVHRYQDMIILRIENTLAEKPTIENKRFKSSKEGHLGVGLSNVKETIEKYSGGIDYNYDEKIFKTRIIIPIQ